MKRKRRRSEGLSASPFVVLADLTIAMAFAFAVQGLATAASSSQALTLLQREDRQSKLQTGILDKLKTLFAGATVVQRRNKGDTRDHAVLYDKDGTTELAEIWVNGNFQRVMVLKPLFRPGDTNPSSEATPIYSAIGSVIKQDAGGIAYLFVHGITEPKEMPSPSGEAISREATRISRTRADIIFNMLQQARVIGSPKAPEATVDADNSPVVPAKYAISYGTGKDLYWQGLPVGRVDLVLFYEDKFGETKSQPPGLVPPSK